MKDKERIFNIYQADWYREQKCTILKIGTTYSEKQNKIIVYVEFACDDIYKNAKSTWMNRSR